MTVLAKLDRSGGSPFWRTIHPRITCGHRMAMKMRGEGFWLRKRAAHQSGRLAGAKSASLRATYTI
jgi:hypothetical protein